MNCAGVGVSGLRVVSSSTQSQSIGAHTHTHCNALTHGPDVTAAPPICPPPTSVHLRIDQDHQTSQHTGHSSGSQQWVTAVGHSSGSQQIYTDRHTELQGFPTCTQLTRSSALISCIVSTTCTVIGLNHVRCPAPTMGGRMEDSLAS